MDKITHWFLGITEVFRLPLLIGGCLNLKCGADVIESNKPESKQIWGDNIPHFIFSDNY